MEAEGPAARQAPASVLDASALMALLHDEDGAEAVVEAIAAGAAISVVNFAEVLSKLADAGKDPDQARTELRGTEAEAGALAIEALSEADCVEVARLRPKTRELGCRSRTAAALPWPGA